MCENPYHFWSYIFLAWSMAWSMRLVWKCILHNLSTGSGTCHYYVRQIRSTLFCECVFLTYNIFFIYYISVVVSPIPGPIPKNEPVFKSVTLVASKGRGRMFLFLLFLPFHSCSSFFPVSLFRFLYCFFYFLSFSGRRHKITHNSWRIVKL